MRTSPALCASGSEGCVWSCPSLEKNLILSSPATHTCPVGYLVRFIEEHAEVGEHHPKLLPPVAVFEFS